MQSQFMQGLHRACEHESVIFDSRSSHHFFVERINNEGEEGRKTDGDTILITWLMYDRGDLGQL